MCDVCIACSYLVELVFERLYNHDEKQKEESMLEMKTNQ